MKNEKIAVLGPEGTFSHQAALRVSNNTEIVFFKTIFDVFVAVNENRCQKGIVPIENSVGGTIGFTLDNLLAFDVKISQEEIVPVIHCLVGTEKTKKESITKIYTHPQSYSQCEKYLRKNFPASEIQETTSNGESARRVSKKTGESAAAIAPEIAAEIYGLKVLEKGIQDNRFNITRFVVFLKEDSSVPSGYDRTSLAVYPQIDKQGLLWEMLGYFAQNKVNLSKIESRPSKGKLGDYVFYLDFQGHYKEPQAKKALSELEKIAFVKILGSYPRKF